MPPATRHCKDGNRRRKDCADTSFTFLGYTFRARQAPTRDGTSMFSAFLPAVHDVDTYMDVRVRESQLEKYYEPKTAKLRQRIWQLKAVQVTLALVAAGLAAVAAISPSVGAWAAVATTAGGAVTAYIAGQRYEFLWIEYSRTASELRRLLDRRTAADGSSLSGPQLVAACEEVISVQNQGWMAKWGKDDTDKAS